MIKQGTPEWFAARCGKVTASRVADVMARTKSGPAASRKNYMMELLCQRLTGVIDESFSSAAMQRGTELEPASPDGLVGDDGLLEIKCPNTATHVDFIRSGKPDGRYMWQMCAQMACTDRAWCDFVSFDDRMPEHRHYACVRIHRDADKEREMLQEIVSFLDELDALVEELK
jgi:hypothetical protein